MNIQIKKYIDPIKNFWINLTKKKKIILMSILGGIILISVIAGILLNIQPFVVLYPGLEHEEAVEVMTELKNRNVSYKEDNGTIYVPKDQENGLRMDLSNEGHPKTAPNYDFFTKNISIMSTDFEKKTIEKYQLNQRLEAVIKTLKNIQNANVTISIPDSSGYAWDENAATPTASVTVQLIDGKTLEAAQVNGIKQLVSKSVPNMKSDDVAVIDTATGDELSSTNGGTQIDISQLKLTIEKEYEKDIEKKVLNVLTPIYGTNNVKVTAKSIMDIDKKVREIITYNPSTTDNKGVISQSDTQKEQQLNGNNTAGGTAGTQSNTGVTTYPGVTVNGNVIYTKDAQSYKYLVSQVKEQIQGDAASVKDMTISVAINKELMAATEKQDISKSIAFAAAILPEKVAIFNTVFPEAAKTTNGQASPAPLLNQIVIIGGAALLTLLLVLLIVSIIISRKRKKQLREFMGQSQDENLGSDVPLKDRLTEAPLPEEIALKAIEGQRAAKASKEEALTKEIQEFSSQNPEIAAQLIRTWLRGDENDG